MATITAVTSTPQTLEATTAVTSTPQMNQSLELTTAVTSIPQTNLTLEAKCTSSRCSSCRNGGTCHFRRYCSCRNSYTGTNCQYKRGVLSVLAQSGHYLPDTDGWLDLSDPYMEVTATDISGYRETHRSRYIRGNLNPRWNQMLWFSGRRAWYKVEATVYDSDNNAPDRLTYTDIFNGVNYVRGYRSRRIGGRNRAEAHYRIYFPN